ncbi:MAG TPA: hypothetical protein VH374_05420 [Polyangia bacterium]|nr:hypothetical protein [Polyangia bacterium]
MFTTLAIAALLAAGGPVAGGRSGAKVIRHGAEINPRTGMALPPFELLVRAVKQRDRGATERIVARMGPGRLTQGLVQTDRRVVLAVLTAAPVSREALLLTEPVADLTSSSDPAVAAAAAHTMGQLLNGETAADFELWEVPPDVVAHACAALRGLALRGLAAAPARLAALVALADATGVCNDTDELLPILKDADGGLRRAAAQAVRPLSTAAVAALSEAIRDPAPGVQTAAVATLCRRERALFLNGRRIDAGAAAAAFATARVLILQPSTPADDAVDMLGCLNTAGTAADKKIEDQLRRGSPSPVRDLLAPPPPADSAAAPAKGP